MNASLDYQSAGTQRRISKMAIAAACIAVLAEPVISGHLLFEFSTQLASAKVPRIAIWLLLFVMPGTIGCLLGLVAMIRIVPRTSNLKGMLIAFIGFTTGIVSVVHGSMLGIFFQPF
jgi:hypothetical protein